MRERLDNNIIEVFNVGTSVAIVSITDTDDDQSVEILVESMPALIKIFMEILDENTSSK